MDEAKPVVAQALITLRGKVGMTQRELADASGVTEKTISNIETGEVWPRASTQAKLAVALGVDEGYFQSLGFDSPQAFDAPTVSTDTDRVVSVMREGQSLAEKLSNMDLINELKSRLLSMDGDRHWLMQQVTATGQKVEELQDENDRLRAQLGEEIPE